MSAQISFTVVIPVYNGSAYLAETIESVLAQSHPAAEIYCIDDGSKDDSAEIAQRYSKNVRVIVRENAGVSATRNLGAELASTEWICFLDQDDVWEPDHLARQAKAIETAGEADVCYAGRRYLYRNPEGPGFSVSDPVPLPSTEKLPGCLLERCPFTPSAVSLRRSVLLEVGGFNSRHDFVEDWDLWLRLLRRGASFVHSAAPTLKYRVHAASASYNSVPVLERNIEFIERNILPFFTPFQRQTRGRKTISRLEGEAAILLRQKSLREARRLMLRSIVRHPLHSGRRYKVAAHMVLFARPNLDFHNTTRHQMHLQ